MSYGTERAVPPVVSAILPGSSAMPAERRRDWRASTVFTIGKLSFNDRSLPCMVRDLSEGGMRIQLPFPPPPGACVLIEMRGLESRMARVRWTSGDETGLMFDLRCCPEDIFAARSNRLGRIARQPRFPLRRSVKLLLDGTPLATTIDNISVGGAQLTVATPLQCGLRGVLDLALGNRHGLAGDVRWSQDGRCGFRFMQPISSMALAMMLDQPVMV